MNSACSGWVNPSFRVAITAAPDRILPNSMAFIRSQFRAAVKCRADDRDFSNELTRARQIVVIADPRLTSARRVDKQNDIWLRFIVMIQPMGGNSFYCIGSRITFIAPGSPA